MNQKVILFILLLGVGVVGSAACSPGPEAQAIAGGYVLDTEATQAALLADLEAWAAEVEAGTGDGQVAALVQETHRKAIDYLEKGRWSAEISLSADGTWAGWYEWLEAPSRPPPPPPGSAPPPPQPPGPSASEPHRVDYSGTWKQEGDRITFDAAEDRGGDYPRPARLAAERIEMLNRQGRAVEVFRRK